MRILSALALLTLTATAWSQSTSEPAAAGGHRVATFAGGCFWCVESDFDHVRGVISTTSGYTGGHTENPSYKEVSGEATGHYEAVEIVFDPTKVSYQTLLDVFWRSVDPTDAGGQFCDRGDSYRTAIFANDEKQLAEALESKQAIENDSSLRQPIATVIEPAKTFYPAEEYHQNYYKKNPLRYKYYRFSCGRDARIGKIWGDKAHRGIKEH